MKLITPRLFARLALAMLLISAHVAHAARLLKQNFETTNPWSAMAGYFTTGGGTVTATPSYTTAGTIDAYGTSTASSGIQLTVNSSAATGNWSAGVDSGVLNLLTANTRGTSFLTLAFSLSASSAYPVRVKIESYNSGSTRTGGLATLIFPVAADFYQRYALDLDKMTADGPGSFNPADPKVRISFEIDNTANGTGWPLGAAHTLKFDNISYATPKYYVKPASIGGNDGNNGLTEATAVATIQAAANKTLSGDNIIAIMDDGTPGAADYLSSNINGDMVNFSKPGAPDAWVVFKNYPGDMPVLTTAGWDAFRICNNSSGGSAAYVEIRGLTIRGHSFFDANGDRQINPAYQSFVGQTASQSNSNGIGVDRGYNNTNLPHNIRVADNIIEFCAGANGCSGDRQTFENNIIRYNCWWMKYAGSGISFAFSVDTETGPNYRNLIQNNIIYGNECMIPWYGIPSKSNPYSDGNGIIIDSHTAGYNGGSGIHALKASNVDIVHNTVYMNSASSSQAYGQVFTQSTGTGAGQTVTNAKVSNNIMFAGRNTTGINSYLYNEAATGVATSVASTIFHRRNVYAGGDTTPPLAGANLSDNTDLGRSYNASSLFISPSIDPTVADFRLRAAAVANNYGSVIGYRSSRDLALTPRLIAGTTETGAYETITALAYSPVFTPKSGTYTTPQSVTLVSDTAGARARSNGGGFRGLISASKPGTNDYVSGFNLDLGGKASADAITSLNAEGAGFSGELNLLPEAVPFGKTFSASAIIGVEKVSAFVGAVPRASRARGKDTLLHAGRLLIGARSVDNVGNSPTSLGFFDGDIFEVLIYDRALSAEEVGSVSRYFAAKYSGVVYIAEAKAEEVAGSVPSVAVENPPVIQPLVPGFTARKLPVALGNVNCLSYHPDGRLFAGAYDGKIYTLTDTDDDGLEDKAGLFYQSEDLKLVMGMALTPPGYPRGEDVFVATRARILLILDRDHDGKGDEVVTVTENWEKARVLGGGVSDALGMAVSKDGSVYFSLGTHDFTNAYLLDAATGKAGYTLAGERGTIQRVSLPLLVSFTTASGDPTLTASWFTDRSATLRPFPLRRILMPYAKAQQPAAPPHNEELPQLAGADRANGQTLFTALCATCHQMRGAGGRVGPDLTNLIYRDYDSVLRDIANPNAAINPEHVAYTVTKKDGSEITAVLLAENSSSVSLAQIGAPAIEIPRTDITGMKQLTISLMPSGLDKAIDPKQLRDLMSYLLLAPK